MGSLTSFLPRSSCPRQPTTKPEQLFGAEILQNSTRHFQNIFLAQTPLAAKRLHILEMALSPPDGPTRLLLSPVRSARTKSSCGWALGPRTLPGVCGWLCPAQEPPTDVGRLTWSQTGWVQIPALPLAGPQFPCL